MKKLCYISMLASPHQIKFCYALQKYYDTEFWFYERTGSRQVWWAIPLGDKCKIVEGIFFKVRGKYMTFSLLKMLNNFKPDIVMLGGVTIPANFVAYLWAKRKKCKTVLFTERSRDREGNLRKYSLVWRCWNFLYRKVDLILVSSEDVVPQFRDTFRFGKKVVPARYAADIDAYFNHPFREAKSAYTYLFANRLTPIYDPLKAIAIFQVILEEFPESKLKMNASGELFERCKKEVEERKLSNSVEFLTNITSWDELNKVYCNSDIMILPASFSNGNFTIMEAMASGMGIVISNKILGTSSYFKDGINGFCCDPEINVFIKQIKRYISMPYLFKQHAIVNREAVRPFSLGGTAEFTAKIFRKNQIE